MMGVGRRGARVLVAVLVGAMGGGCAAKGPRATAPPPAHVLQPAAAASSGPYRIGVGDELDVRFLYQPDMSQHVVVRPDGRISLPATGEVAVAGLTPGELEKLIVDQTSERLRNPEVVVVLTQLAEQRVYVGGEVARPGYVPLRTDLTPLQAIIQAGGFHDTAQLRSVLLFTPAGNGQFQAVRMNLEQVVEDGVPERVRLHANDVVYVPTTWIADADRVVDQWVRGLIPALPRVGVGYSLGQ